MVLLNIIRGFFMAIADSVPGVSGGTIAFIMGFYDEFIDSLNSFISKSKDKLIKRKKSLLFLANLGVGWIIGLGLSVFILASIFDKEIYKISSLFIGFIIFSIPLIIKQEKNNLLNKFKNIIYTILGVSIVCLITYFNPVSSNATGGLTISHFTIPLAFYVFFVGVVAISAMVLPGISGSTLLLIFGLYASIISAVKATISFNFEYVPILSFFGLGILLGIVTVVRLLRWLLIYYRSQIVYFILGLMVGSVYAVLMGPTTLEIPKEAMNLQTFNIFFFLLGGLLIFGLDEIKRVTSK